VTSGAPPPGPTSPTAHPGSPLPGPASPTAHPGSPPTSSMDRSSAAPPAGSSPAGPGAAIEVRGLLKRYEGRAVVDGLDLTVEPGSIVALLGPNGAGKTTTIEILEGYRRADGGSVRVLSLDPARDGERLRPRIGLMLQEGGVYPQARPRELLRLYARFFRDPLDPDSLLDQLGLGTVATTRWRRLSGGERQRLSLGLALVGRPELLMLDEPTAGMDPAAKASTRELIDELRRDGRTILLTTHELPDVERLADRIVVVAAGRIVAAGSPAELLAGARPRLRLRLDRPLDAVERASLESEVERAAREHPGADPVTTGATLDDDGASGRYRIEGAQPDPALVGTIAAWCAARGVLIVELRAAGATLEERYLELVGGPDAVTGHGDGSGRLDEDPSAAPGGGRA
jgi:ABC-2 type transport system ATP-binding protein